MKYILSLFLTIASIGTYKAQWLENAEFLRNVSAFEITALAGIAVAHDVDLYKIRYYTPGIDGSEQVASGLACIPTTENLQFPLLSYQHGTVAGRDDVPSNQQGGYELALILSSLGYVVTAADYLGLGDSPGIHPYVHADTEASAGFDLMRAVKEMSQNDDFSEFHISDQVFLSGYSQGGHASMALHRLIESEYSDEYTVTAAAHMSGPYSVSEKMRDFTLGEEEYATVSYLAWLTLGYMEVYPEIIEDLSLEDIFRDVFIDDIVLFRDELIDRFQLNNRMSNILRDSFGGVFPREILKSEVLDQILNNPDYPLSRVLALNDTYDWAPVAPTNLYYCEGDDQVTFENAILAEQIMKQNGSTNVRALQRDQSAPLDHGGCVVPAVTGLNFFFDFYRKLLSSNEELAIKEDIQIFYGSGQVHIDLPYDLEGDFFLMKIFGMDGKEIVSKRIEKGISLHSLEYLSSGMLVTSIFDNGGIISSQKIVLP